jgi:hypothetical protein
MTRNEHKNTYEKGNHRQVKIDAVEFNFVAGGKAFYILASDKAGSEPRMIEPLYRITCQKNDKIGLIFYYLHELKRARDILMPISSGKWLAFEQGARTPYEYYSRVHSYKTFGQLETLIQQIMPDLVEEGRYGVHEIYGGIELFK